MEIIKASPVYIFLFIHPSFDRGMDLFLSLFLVVCLLIFLFDSTFAARLQYILSTLRFRMVFFKVVC
eukprot:m.11144 g.11144  ORF g.11144 m.11144 type:complete len:67 (-) comp6388_c0_seq1:913-1113(-)